MFIWISLNTDYVWRYIIMVQEIIHKKQNSIWNFNLLMHDCVCWNSDGSKIFKLDKLHLNWNHSLSQILLPLSNKNFMKLANTVLFGFKSLWPGNLILKLPCDISNTWSNADLLSTAARTHFNIIQSKLKHFHTRNISYIVICKNMAIPFKPQFVKSLRPSDAYMCQ